jgi:cysteine-rich repeat protein
MRRGALSIGLIGLAASLAVACSRSDSAVIVKVTADADVPSVFQLRASVSNAGEGATRFFPVTPAATAIVFDTSFSVTVPRDRSGALDIALDGLDQGGTPVANGAGSVELHAGEDGALTIILHNGASACGNGVIDSGEACDDGDRLSTGTCDFACQPIGSSTGTAGAGGGGGTGGSGTGGGGTAGSSAGRGGSGGTSAGRGGSGGTGTGGSAGTGGHPCSAELLTSGNFDGDNSRWMQMTAGRMQLIWSQTSAPSFTPTPDTAPRFAWLGYDAVSAKPALRQSFAVPADALQLNVMGYYQIQTDESGCACDYARVQLDVGGTVTTLLQWSAYDANADWAFFSTYVNATPIAGQTVTLQLQADMDDGVNTSFYFDSLTVTADLCP